MPTWKRGVPLAVGQQQVRLPADGGAEFPDAFQRRSRGVLGSAPMADRRGAATQAPVLKREGLYRPGRGLWFVHPYRPRR